MINILYNYTKQAVAIGALLVAFGAGLGLGKAIFEPEKAKGDGGSTTPLEWEDYPLRPNMWLEATVPDLADAYRPDSSSLDTTSIVVLDTLIRKDTVYKDLPDYNYGSAKYSTPDVTLQGRFYNRYYDFLLLPIINNNPAIEVTSDYCRAQVYDPQDGTGFDLKYKVPQESNRIGPFLGLCSSYNNKLNPFVELGIWYERKNLRFDGGYRFHSVEKLSGWNVRGIYYYELDDIL